MGIPGRSSSREEDQALLLEKPGGASDGGAARAGMRESPAKAVVGWRPREVV